MSLLYLFEKITDYLFTFSLFVVPWTMHKRRKIECKKAPYCDNLASINKTSINHFLTDDSLVGEVLDVLNTCIKISIKVNLVLRKLI